MNTTRTNSRAAAAALVLPAVCYLIIGLITTRGIFNAGISWDEGLSEYIPWRMEMGRQLAAGHFPFFTKNLFGGMPLFSLSYVGVLYPPNWLYAIFPATLSNWLQVFHTIVGGLGMFCYLRARRLGELACFLGGLFYITNTFMIFHAGHIAMREAAMLSPWVALAALSFLMRPGARAIATLALALALQIFAGYLQVTLFTIVWIGADWLVVVLRGRRPVARTAGLLAGGLLGVALGAVQIIPTLLHIPQTPRVHMAIQQWQIGSFPASHALSFLVPRAFGIHSAIYVGDSYPGEIFVTIAPVAWALAFVAVLSLAIARRRNGARGMMVVVYTVIIILSFFLALGSYYLPNAALFGIPPFSMFRVPGRWLFVATTLACVLAATGVQWLVSHRPFQRLALISISFIAFGAVSVGLFFVFAGTEPNTRLTSYNLANTLLHGVGVSDGRLKPAFLNAPILATILGFLACIILVAGRKFPRAVALCIFLLIALDQNTIYRYGTDWPVPRTEILGIATHPLLSKIDTTRIVRLYGLSPHGDNIGTYGLPHATGLLTEIPMLNGYSPLLSDRLYITLGVGQTGVSHRDTEYYTRVSPLRNLAVSHLIVEPKSLTPERRAAYDAALADGRQYRAVTSARDFDLLEVVNPRPRFDLARQWTPPSGDPLQLDTYVFQNEPGAPLPPDVLENPDWKLLPPADTPIRGASLNVLLDEPAHQRVRVVAPNGAVILIRDVFWNGWQYRIEGLQDGYHEIGRADGVIRYVPAPMGTHDIDMRFIPPGFQLGRIVSITSLIIILVLMGFSIRARQSVGTPIF